LALEVARRHAGIEIVSIDSMQVYRGMDIGTAKPTVAERAEVPHHLIDLVEPSEDFTVAQFQAAFRDVMGDIERRGARALLVGGTGLHFRAVVDDLDIPGRFPSTRAELDRQPDTAALHRRLAELDPVAAGRMEPTNRRRVVRALEVVLGSGRPFSSFGPGLDRYPDTDVVLLGLQVPRLEIDERIERRFARQMDAGFLDEVRRLAAQPGDLSSTARQALGYRELLTHVEDGVDLDEAVAQAIVRTRQFARRQERWFRRDPRIVWFEGGSGHNPLGALEARLED
jgi:tRNA dimethylallyltransferase